MTSDRSFRPFHELADPTPPARHGGVPGKSTLTSRLMGPRMVLRVADPATARALGEALAGGRVQRDANGVAADAEHAVARASGAAGAPLRDDLRTRFESSLGADLSGVRVHTGAESAAASDAVGARAYTVGHDIHFGAGQYQPDDPFGMHLIAHEVAHTVQQAGGAPRRQHKLEVSTPGDHAEVEADRAADAMVQGAPFAVGDAGPSVARASFGEDAAAGAANNKTPAGAAATTTSLSITGKGVTGSIDWANGIKGKIGYKVEQDIYKPPAIVQQFKIASYKEVGGMLGEINVGAELKYGGELTATGAFEAGKGGSITLGGSGFLEAGLSGQAKIAGYGGVVGHANINAGVVGQIAAKASAALAVTNPVFGLAADGAPTGAAQIDGDLTVEQTATWGLECGWYFNKKAGTMAALQLGSKPLGKLSNIGFSLTLNADGSVTGPTWKWPPVWTPPAPLTFTEGAQRPLTPEEKQQFQQQAEREAGERDGGSGAGAGVPAEAYDEGEAGEAGEAKSFDELCGEDDASVMCDPGGDPDSIMYGSGPGVP